MKILAALFLSLLLAVMAYGIFWLVCLNFTTTQMRGAVKEALQAEMTYGTAQWVPDPVHVTMDLPAVKLVMAQGPVREVHANTLRVASDFLTRDRWTMNLPKRVELVLANGQTVQLESEKGQIIWLREGSRLTLRAANLRLLAMDGSELAKVGDVMLERKAADKDVRLNLASRPQLAGGEAVISGQMVMPAEAFAQVMALYGTGVMPGMGEIFRTVAVSLQQRGGTLQLDNVSFKMGQSLSGAVFGSVKVLPDGRLTGSLAVTSTNSKNVLEWIEKAGLLMPRNKVESIGMNRFMAGLAGSRATARMENMQETLMMNGYPVGPMPQGLDVVRKLWP